jgi:hypothetical protein
MSPESLQSLVVLLIGFAVAGLLATGYQLVTEQPLSFRLLNQGLRLVTFLSIPVLTFAAPFVIMRNVIRGRRIERRRFEFVMLATVLAGFWSLMSGTVVVTAFKAFSQLSPELDVPICAPRRAQMAIYELDGQAPELSADGRCWVAETAVVIGRVRLKQDASVWWGSVLRGDNEWIEVGERTNIQETARCTPTWISMVIGADCTIGHNVVLHGCTIAAGSLIGMGAVVLNGARIGRVRWSAQARWSPGARNFPKTR